MKFLGGYFFRAMCALFIGLLLIVQADKMPNILVMIIGGLFLLPGCCGVFIYLSGRLNPAAIIRPSFPLVSIGSILFGAYLLAFPDAFVVYLVMVMGFIITLAGISQLSGMFTNRHVTPFSWILIILPLALIGIGVFCIMHSKDAATLTFQIIGGTLIYYGFSDMFLALRMRHYSRVYAKEQAKREEAERRAREAEYVDFEVVDTSHNDE